MIPLLPIFTYDPADYPGTARPKGCPPMTICDLGGLTIVWSRAFRYFPLRISLGTYFDPLDHFKEKWL
jgi:hypothetical protein